MRPLITCTDQITKTIVMSQVSFNYNLLPGQRITFVKNISEQDLMKQSISRHDDNAVPLVERNLSDQLTGMILML